VHAETNALLPELASEAAWVSVIKEGSESTPFTERVRHFSSQVLADTQIGELASQVERLGTTPVELFFQRHGFKANRQNAMVEVFAELPSSQLPEDQ
jgi:hypothetical protein